MEGKQDVRDGAVESELSFLYAKQSNRRGEERREYTRRGGGEMGNLSWLPREDSKEVCEGR